MKAKRLLAALCVALSLGLFVTIFTAICNSNSLGSLATNSPTFGTTQIVVTGTNALCLSSSAVTAGTTSVPCQNVQLQITGGSVLVGASAGTAGCAYPLYVCSAGSTGNMSYSMPGVTNLNQMFFYAPTGTSTVSTCYAQ